MTKKLLKHLGWEVNVLWIIIALASIKGSIIDYTFIERLIWFLLYSATLVITGIKLYTFTKD